MPKHKSVLREQAQQINFKSVLPKQNTFKSVLNCKNTFKSVFNLLCLLSSTLSDFNATYNRKAFS
jgi:hypothetical protein